MALKGQGPAKTKRPPVPMKQARATASVGAAEPIQSLNVIEEKLRREFNLVGQIGARLNAGVIPVIIAADLRDMGHAVDRGRGWCVTAPVGQSWAANAYFSFRFTADVLVEAYMFSASAADDVALYSTTPDETIPIAAAIASGAWRDRKVISTDIPPIFTSATTGALTGTAISNSNRLTTFRVSSGGAVGSWVPLQMMIPAGGALTFRSHGAGIATSNFGLIGRMWP